MLMVNQLTGFGSGGYAPTLFVAARSSSNITIASAGKRANGGSGYTGWEYAGTNGDRVAGKWYWEFLAVAGTYWVCGVGRSDETKADGYFPGAAGNYGYGYYSGGQIYNNGYQASYTPSAYAVNDVIGVKLDLVNMTIEFLKNNASAAVITGIPAGVYFPAATGYGSVAVSDVILRTTAAEFSYSVPSGFEAIG